MKGNFIIATTARPSRQGAGCDHFIGASKGHLKESSPCLLLLGEGAAAAADVEGTHESERRATLAEIGYEKSCSLLSFNVENVTDKKVQFANRTKNTKCNAYLVYLIGILFASATG